jgi:hypothetical protein
MPLLIDALQSGSELFSRGKSTAPKQANNSLYENDEVGLMLGSHQKNP